ncbi:MAG: hypothetical protein K2W95_22670 [Candidatus Obscuribacterales bacterium]|nr:hypothetical protein [Candidatus Obscuribacterales bacterium]
MTEITLNLQYPIAPEYAAAHAGLCVEGAKQVDDIDLDFSPESLEYLDQIVSSWREEENPDLDQIASVLFTFGCYVGEVFVRNAGAKWVVGSEGEGGMFPIHLTLENGTVCRPIDKVFRMLDDGTDGNISYFYELYTGCDSSEEKELVPILRTLDKDDYFSKSAVNIKIADDLGVFACRKIITPDGNVGIDYVMKDQVNEDEVTEDQLIDYCYENFFAGNIEVTGYEQDGDQMMEFTHEEGLVSAMIGHPETYEKFSEMLGTRDILILVVSPDSLLATRKGSSFEAGLHKMASDLQTEGGAIYLVPGVYHWNEGKLARAVM